MLEEEGGNRLPVYGGGGGQQASCLWRRRGQLIGFCLVAKQTVEFPQVLATHG